MRRILRRLEWVCDDWRDAGEPEALPGARSHLILPYASFLKRPPEPSEGPLGVRVSPADAVEDLAPYLAGLGLIAIEFPGPGEGRGYSQARLLRTRWQFGGELRAVGAAVKQDLLFIMARCGIDSFELAPGQDPDTALRALQRYTVAYQPGAALASIERQRFRQRGTLPG
jgi:uncharacterized protein (DUF934 family)